LGVTWRKFSEATVITCEVQASSDLKSWEELDLEPYAISRTQSGGHAEVTLYLPVDLSVKLFVRVAVTKQ
jgi:hypothetical protein